MELPVADVDGDDRRRAALEDAVGEPARRRAGVEHASAFDVDGEGVEGGVELLAAPADEPRRRARSSMIGSDRADEP